MILEDNDLRHNTSATMAAVWRFVGLPHLDVSQFNSSDVYKKCVRLSVCATFRAVIVWCDGLWLCVQVLGVVPIV